MNQVDLKRKLDQILAALVDGEDDDSTIQTALEALIKLFHQTDDPEQRALINQKIKEVFMYIDDSIAQAEGADLEATIQMWKDLWADLSLSKHGIELKDVDTIAKTVKFNPAEEIAQAVEEAVEAAIVKSQEILDALDEYGDEGSTRDKFTDEFSDMPTIVAEAIDKALCRYKHYDFLAETKVENLSDAYIARKRLRKE
jgi:hypothetical protein